MKKIIIATLLLLSASLAQAMESKKEEVEKKSESKYYGAAIERIRELVDNSPTREDIERFKEELAKDLKTYDNNPRGIIVPNSDYYSNGSRGIRHSYGTPCYCYYDNLPQDKNGTKASKLSQIICSLKTILKEGL